MGTSLLQAVESWHDFYAVTGGASAALVGLLFTTMALRSNWVGQSSLAVEQDLWSAASVPLACFLDILLLSLTFLVPDQSAPGLGLPVLALAALGAVQLLWAAVRPWATPALRLRGRLIPVLLCYLGQALVGVAVATDHSTLLWILALVIGVLIVTAAIASWELLKTPILVRAKRSGASQPSHASQSE
jgi:hypothetical protein